ncbi:hypothetical protein G6O69_36995 [Pseudenhygromyxa sp. WMMC2535]|uniref:hypothetical protein n=1 Tax=Pseudenhygromyxa sp. WMMC2535 TaxID=2712867 RepID=UPI001595EB6B|nr:hypothetical protein [Pseudenhygromyxa sp. WMMC2535]NVB43476.1 hypothetical protein [Pseudenhygromyxa sp. WMMC2535]
MSADAHDPRASAPAPKGADPSPAQLVRGQQRSYLVDLSPREVLDRLAEQPGVKAYDSHLLPDFGGLIEDADYTLERIGEREFSIHCGPRPPAGSRPPACSACSTCAAPWSPANAAPRSSCASSTVGHAGPSSAGWASWPSPASAWSGC